MGYSSLLFWVLNLVGDPDRQIVKQRLGSLFKFVNWLYQKSHGQSVLYHQSVQDGLVSAEKLGTRDRTILLSETVTPGERGYKRGHVRVGYLVQRSDLLAVTYYEAQVRRHSSLQGSSVTSGSAGSLSLRLRIPNERFLFVTLTSSRKP